MYSPGRYRLTIERDPALSAQAAGRVSIDIPRIDYLAKGKSSDYTAQSMAPILYARANTVGAFTDVPMLMWYEMETTSRGWRLRYSVVFSNEDGGTATDRLMATWGRTTDIEYVYGVEVDEHDQILAEEFQGPGHEVPPFTGRHEGGHPLLWVSTDNNMVSESGTTQVRYAPAVERFDLANQSREVVMDRHAWTYTVAAQEMTREGKIVADAPAGSGKVPDLRRYVHVEACTELENAAVAFSIRAADSTGAPRWYDSDRGLSEFRIVRSGCFRGAVPLPASAGRPEAVRFRAFSRAQRGAAPASSSVVLTRVNTVFTLDERYQPGGRCSRGPGRSRCRSTATGATCHSDAPLLTGVQKVRSSLRSRRNDSTGRPASQADSRGGSDWGTNMVNERTHVRSPIRSSRASLRDARRIGGRAASWPLDLL